MPENDIHLDFSPNPQPRANPQPGSASAVAVPRYVLYGDSGPRPQWFVNLEPLETRCRERGWVIKPHVHPRFSQIMVVRQGGGVLTLEGEDKPFDQGSVVIVPPHRIHGFRYLADVTGWVLTIENHYLDDLLERAPALRAIVTVPGVFALDAGGLAECEAGIARLGEEMTGGRAGAAIGAEIHLLSVLLLLFRYRPPGDATAPAAPGAGQNRARLVARYKALVESRFRQQPALAEVARELGASESQLRLACVEVTGLSPLAILHERLLTEARRCLAYSSLSITEIAVELGFSDGSYFTRFFTRKTGQAPSLWRRQQAESHGLVAASQG